MGSTSDQPCFQGQVRFATLASSCSYHEPGGGRFAGHTAIIAWKAEQPGPVGIKPCAGPDPQVNEDQLTVNRIEVETNLLNGGQPSEKARTPPL